MGLEDFIERSCPDCGRTLHNIWDYPANELWCVHCGNRYFAALGGRRAESPNHPLAGFRVLLLDENGARRDRLARRFTQLGYLVTPVCHPRQALEAASFRRFDLVILPTSASEFDCRSLVRKLRQLLGNLKFVVVGDHESSVEDGKAKDPAADWSALPGVQVEFAHVCRDACDELERVVENAIDELLAERARQRGAPDEIEELLGTS